MCVKFTVAICTHNGRDRIARPLAALAEQSLPPAGNWNALVIDNGSTDDSIQVARETAEQYELPLRVVAEPQLGLIYARRRAAREASGAWLAFWDDDNLPAHNWLARASEFVDQRHPQMGIFGGRVVPTLERPDLRPGNFTDEHFGVLGCRDRGRESFLLDRGFPVGAGMVIRRDLLRTICDEIGVYSVGRQGAALTGCEDAEIACIARKLGWQLWHCGSLWMEHLMPPHRVQHDYRDRLTVAAIKSSAWLQVLQQNSEVRTRLDALRNALPDSLTALKYSALSLLPPRLHPKLCRARHWCRFYTARASGWYGLAADFDRANNILSALRRHARDDRHTLLPSLSPETAATTA
jgi:glycosyltransferase involved in cell wall biosynthesis